MVNATKVHRSLPILCLFTILFFQHRLSPNVLSASGFLSYSSYIPLHSHSLKEKNRVPQIQSAFHKNLIINTLSSTIFIETSQSHTTSIKPQLRKISVFKSYSSSNCDENKFCFFPKIEISTTVSNFSSIQPFSSKTISINLTSLSQAVCKFSKAKSTNSQFEQITKVQKRHCHDAQKQIQKQPIFNIIKYLLHEHSHHYQRSTSQLKNQESNQFSSIYSNYNVLIDTTIKQQQTSPVQKNKRDLLKSSHVSKFNDNVQTTTILVKTNTNIFHLPLLNPVCTLHKERNSDKIKQKLSTNKNRRSLQKFHAIISFY